MDKKIKAQVDDILKNTTITIEEREKQALSVIDNAKDISAEERSKLKNDVVDYCLKNYIKSDIENIRKQIKESGKKITLAERIKLEKAAIAVRIEDFISKRPFLLSMFGGKLKDKIEDMVAAAHADVTAIKDPEAFKVEPVGHSVDINAPEYETLTYGDLIVTCSHGASEKVEQILREGGSVSEKAKILRDLGFNVQVKGELDMQQDMAETKKEENASKSESEQSQPE